MGKRVPLVAKILDDMCTGCRLCEQVCPTVAITMRKREPDEIGPGKNIAVMHDASCYNAQACLEICPDEAIVMEELAEPFEVGVNVEEFDQKELSALCRAAGFPAKLIVCPCTNTTAGELAAAVLSGADTPDKLSLKTGVRTGCTELCLQPMLQILTAAGHTDMPRNPRSGFQWYGLAGTLFEHLREDGTYPEAFEEKFAIYQPTKEYQDMQEAASERRKARKT